MASSVSDNQPRTIDQRRLLTGGAVAFFVLVVVSLLIGQTFIAVLALLGAFAFVMGAAFGRSALPGGGSGGSARADRDDRD